jgi:cytochrome c-type biogenesis protein
LADLPLIQLGLSLAAGSLTTLSPCVFPLLPLVLAGAVQPSRWSPLAMGAGMAASFAILGLAVGALGPALGIDGEAGRTAGAWLLLGFAVTMLVPGIRARFGAWLAPLASVANAASSRLEAGSIGGAFVLGAVLGAVWSPCSGPLLSSTLTLAASGGGAGRGALLLGLFGLGAAAPLVAVAYASRRGFAVWRERILARVDAIQRGFALLLAALGVSILTGADKWLEARILDLLPEAWVALTTRI